MGLRLSFGFGPLRASVPLTGKKRKRRGKTFHGIIRNAKGRVVWKCEHNHQTMTAAETCSARHAKSLRSS
jgi:hypothetical protein